MDPEEFRRVKELYERLLGRTPQDRRAQLDELDPPATIRAEVEALLEHTPSSTVFTEERLGGLAREVAASIEAGNGGARVSSDERLPEQIGEYRIESVLGRGGMGIVYRALQERPQREVALKAMHAFAFDEVSRRRFEYEAEILARMDHPCVAQVFQAGIDTTRAEPVPFIAMELVSGEDIVSHFGDGASTAEILRVFELVCSGVEHAHQRGVVHRDLKPANIMVSADGRPRILDFGIARPLQESNRSTPGRTEPGVMLGSLAWMSPEQARGELNKIDVRCDVYALGVILFRLLAGEMPYDVSELPPWRAASVICEQEPKRLGRVRSELRGDLELIVGMALEKEASRRYPSAGALAADIRRFVANQPIEARPWSVAYQVRKFARRHRLLVGAALLLASTVTVGFVVGIALWLRSESALGSAQRELLTSERVVRFLVDMFTEENPWEAGTSALRGERLTVKEVLDREAPQIQGEFAEEPLVRARLMLAMGEVYRALGLYEGALPLLEGALAVRRERLGEDHVDSLDAGHLLGRLYLDLWRAEDADSLLQDVLARRRRVLGESHDKTIKTLYALGTLSLRIGRLDEAQERILAVLEHRRTSLGEDAPETLVCTGQLASLYIYQGRHEEAERLYVQNLEANRRVRGEDHPETLATLANLATLYMESERVVEARELLRDVYERASAALGDLHPYTTRTLHNLGRAYCREGRTADGEQLFLEVLDRITGDMGSEQQRAATLASLGDLYERTGRSAQAEPVYVEALALGRRALGDDHPETLVYMSNLGCLYFTQLGRFAESQSLLEESVERSQRVLGPDHPHANVFRRNLRRMFSSKLEHARSTLGVHDPTTLAVCVEAASQLRVQGEHEAAEALFLEALEGYSRSGRRADSEVLACREALVELYRDRGRLQEAAAQARELLALTPEESPAHESRERLAQELDDAADAAEE